MPVFTEVLDREYVCQNVLQLRRKRVLCGKSVHSVHALATSFNFLFWAMCAVN